AELKGLTAEPIRVNSDKKQLQQLCTLFSEGALSLNVEKYFDFQQVAEAHQLSEGGHARGKIILRF
ncbi:MAG: zinc-binding dehydrogenase, partial [Motiliproteus sp.]|nr:zinc-binding dehydrogenase [Motiliproteus sp.]